jgi:hypothetical protein
MDPVSVFLIAFIAGCLTGFCVHHWNRYRGTRMVAD